MHFGLQAVSNTRVEFNLFSGVHDLFIAFLFLSSDLTCSITNTLLFSLCLNSVSFSPWSLFLQSIASMTSTQVKVNRALSVPPVHFDLPLAANHRASVTIAPPSAHIGTAPVQMRLISYDLREGQVINHYSVYTLVAQWSFIISNCVQN